MGAERLPLVTLSMKRRPSAGETAQEVHSTHAPAKRRNAATINGRDTRHVLLHASIALCRRTNEE